MSCRFLGLGWQFALFATAEGLLELAVAASSAVDGCLSPPHLGAFHARAELDLVCHLPAVPRLVPYLSYNNRERTP